MKDYNLIKFVAKQLGIKAERGKHILTVPMVLNGKGTGNKAVIYYSVLFEKRQSYKVLVDLEDVYEKCAQSSYPDSKRFMTAFVQNYPCFQKEEIGGDVYVTIDLRINKADHVVSQALTAVSLTQCALDEMLGTHSTILNEEDWRNQHRKYLDRCRKTSMLGAGLSVVVFALSVTCFSFQMEIQEVGLGIILFLSLIAAPLSVLAFIFFLLRKRFYRSHLKKSLQAKN